MRDFCSRVRYVTWGLIAVTGAQSLGVLVSAEVHVCAAWGIGLCFGFAVAMPFVDAFRNLVNECLDNDHKADK